MVVINGVEFETTMPILVHPDGVVEVGGHCFALFEPPRRGLSITGNVLSGPLRDRYGNPSSWHSDICNQLTRKRPSSYYEFPYGRFTCE